MTKENLDENKLKSIRGIYYEPQGFLKEAPRVEEGRIAIFDSSIWELFNRTVDKLSMVTGRDYSEYKLVPTSGHQSLKQYKHIKIETYRQRLSGLIGHPYSEYLEESVVDPIHNQPEVLINQFIQQQQAVSIQMLLFEIESKISKYPENSKERTFLQRVKELANSGINLLQFITKLINLAKELGMSYDEVIRVLSG